MLCSANTATMNLRVNASTIDGDVYDKIEKGILKMADSKALGSLSLNGVIISGELLPFYRRCSAPDITDYS